MQNFVRNVSKKLARNPFLLQSINEISHRNASVHLNSHKLAGIQRPQQLSSSCLHSRCYSIQSDDSPPQNPTNSERKLPKLSNEPLLFGAPFFSFLTSNFKAMKIRKYDRDFSIQEFVEGSKKAVEIVSNKLASADLDGLRGLVTDEVIDNLRDKINAMTYEQRQELLTAPEDICTAVMQGIEIKEEDDTMFVKITMVYHIVRGFLDLQEGRIEIQDNFIKKSSDYLDDNFYILNYKFVKEFSEDSNDDWIVSFLNHVSIRDEMMEQTKGFDEMMRKIREQNQKK